jgi:hypothetical protein
LPVTVSLTADSDSPLRILDLSRGPPATAPFRNQDSRLAQEWLMPLESYTVAKAAIMKGCRPSPTVPGHVIVRSPWSFVSVSRKAFHTERHYALSLWWKEKDPTERMSSRPLSPDRARSKNNTSTSNVQLATNSQQTDNVSFDKNLYAIIILYFLFVPFAGCGQDSGGIYGFSSRADECSSSLPSSSSIPRAGRRVWTDSTTATRSRPSVSRA